MENRAEIARQEIILEMSPGDEHTLQISKDIRAQTDIMYPAFRVALTAAKGIIKSSEKFAEETKLPSESSISNKLYGYSNNIIAFCGKRGQGKTSAMISFAEALGRYNTKKPEDLLEELSETKAENFCVLPPIDPTMLENGSALDVVLSRLFQIAETIWMPSSSSFCYNVPSESVKRELVQLFQHCLSGIRTLRKESRKEDDFENLAYLVDGLQLKKKLYDLIQAFLSLIGLQKETGYIVIQLDDTDLQMDNAYDVLDDICKYLTLPNVIVLVATDIDQLQTLVEHHYLKELEVSVRHDILKTKKIYEMALNYLTKLIPVSQKVYLPSLQQSFKSSKIMILRKGEDIENRQEMHEHFFSKIYEKTGIALNLPDGYMHALMPTTLRGVRHLFRLLDDMEDCGLQPPTPRYHETPYGSGAKQREAVAARDAYLEWIGKRERNLSRLQNYLENEWGESRLNKEDLIRIREMLDSPDGQVVGQLCKVIAARQKINLPAENPCQYSSLVGMVRELENSAQEKEDVCFAAAVKILLSVWLQKTALTCQRLPLDCWDANKKPSFSLPSLKVLFTGGIFGEQRLKEPETYLFERTPEKPNEPLFGTLDGKKFTPDALSFFENMLLYDSSGDDYNDQSIVDQLRRYALFVCCNWEVQEQVRSCLRNKIPSLPNINKERPNKFMGEVNALFDVTKDWLTQHYKYISSVDMPFAYEGTILNNLPQSVQTLLEPLTPSIKKEKEETIKELLSAIARVLRIIDNGYDESSVGLLTVANQTLSAVDVNIIGDDALLGQKGEVVEMIGHLSIDQYVSDEQIFRLRAALFDLKEMAEKQMKP